MISEKSVIIDSIKVEINSHVFQSGEIIIEFAILNGVVTNVENIITNFFDSHLIKTHPQKFDLSEISESQAIKSISYGLSTKTNYTLVDLPFTKSDQNKFAYAFIQAFNNPIFYSINTKVYKKDLDVNDFWETGGAIAIDKNAIGIFWINDLYNNFG